MLSQTAFVHFVEGFAVARAYTDRADRQTGTEWPRPVRWHHRFIRPFGGETSAPPRRERSPD